MAQHDYVLANAAGAAFRSDANDVLTAIVSQNSGATEPATMYAYQWWADTTTGLVKIRNAANSAWISLFTISTGAPVASAAGAALLTGAAFTGLVTLKTGANIASAGTINLSTATGNLVHITGTTATSAVTMTSGQWMRCIADGAWPLTYHATTNRINGGVSRTLEAGDTVDYFYDGTTVIGNITRANGMAVLVAPQTSEVYIYLRDEKASGTAGGTFTTGAWQKRDLNTEVNDAGGCASLSASVIALLAGTYRFRASAPAYAAQMHKVKLKNTSDSIEYIGTSERCPAPGASDPSQSRSFVSGRFTIASTKNFELQHYCSYTKATDGLGAGNTFGVVEVYSEIEFWKEF